jgi:hypothetical protein
MFFQALIYVFLIIVAVYLGWKFVVKPILEGKGIEVEEPPEIQTKHTKTLDELKKEYAEKSASSKAAKEGLTLARKIAKMEEEIKKVDREMEDKDFFSTSYN